MSSVPPVRDKVVSADTPQGKEAIGQQLDRILASSVFKSSKRYPALLRYIVEQTLEGREGTIKERILGVDVFGRLPDYDTNNDHVVRTAAGEVRKRLAQYYMEPGREQELRIEVPAGTYVPQFKTAPELSRPNWPAEATLPPSGGWKKHARLLLIASAILNLVFIIFLVDQNKIDILLRGETTLHKFWAPVLEAGEPVLLCVGTRDILFQGPGRGQSPAQQGGPQQMPPAGQTAQASQPAQTIQAVIDNQDPLMRRVAMADALPLAKITGYVASQRVPYRILNPATTTFTDLRGGPAVFIGAGNNNWARQLTDRLRFSFTTADPNASDNVRPLAIRDNQHPENHNWVTAQGQTPALYREYGLISRLLDQRVEQVIVVIGGLGPHATDAAGEFITDPNQIKKLDAFTTTGWSNKNIQIVLSAEVVRGKSGPPKIEAAWFW